jgi:hypothetical protein
MRNRTAPLLALLALTLAGCPGPVVKVHAPPQYADGVPDDLFYENLALRTQEMAPEGFIPSDPEEAYRLALQELESRGIKIVPKADGFEAWSKFNTTFPTTIYVSNTWDEKTNALKGATLWHELVHVREYDYHTPLQMALMYATSEGRWALEVQAYRESFRVRRIFGVPEEEIREAMRPRAEFLYEEYELGTMPREYAVEKAIEIWMLDSPGN